MTNQRLAIFTFLLLALITVNGCSRETRKARFLRSAQKLEKEGKLAEATLQYRNAIQLDPNSVEARLGFAKLLVRQGDGAGAEAELKKAIAAAPNNLEPRRALASLYVMANKPDWAEEQAEAALKVNPGDTASQELLGAALLRLNKVEDAEKVFNEILQQSGGNVAALLGLSRTRMALKDPHGAEKALREAVIASNSSATVLLSLSSFLESQDRWGEAEQTLRDAETRHPKDLGVLLNLASFYSRHKNDAQAEAALAQIAKTATPRTAERTLLADFYIGKGQPDKAIVQLQQVIEQDGMSDLAVQKLGDLYLDQNRIKDAEALTQKLSKRDSRNVVTQYLEGRLRLAQGDAPGALQKFREAAKYLPKSALLYYYQGMAYLGQKDDHLARSAFSQALDMDPNFGRARLQLAKLELANHDNDLALKDAELAVRTWPVMQSVMLYVDALVQSGKPHVADDLLKKLITDQTQSEMRGMLRVRSAMLDFGERNFTGARTQLENARKDLPASSFPDAAIASSYVLQNDLVHAQQVLDEGMAKFPSSEELALLRADINFRQQKFAIAEQIYRDLIQKNFQNVTARVGLAAVAAARQNWSEAAEILEQVGSNQKSDAALATAGHMREQAGQVDLARKDYEAALQIQPDNAVVLNNLSFLLLNSNGNLDLALRYAERAKELSPDVPEISDTLAWAYYHKDRCQFALQYLQTAISANPNSALYYYHAGKCYLKLQDRTRAEEFFGKALRARGEFPREDTLQELRRLRQTQ